VRWRTEDIHPKGVREDRLLTQARLYTRDSVLEWRTVVVSRDSITGIPSTMSEQCITCRRAIPAAAVDSLRVGYAERRKNDSSDFWLASLIVLGLLFSP
jgi:hypothetical protein